MRRAVALIVLLAFSALCACARHVVVDRKLGILDAKRSISSNGDADWRIHSEPAAGEPVAEKPAAEQPAVTP